MRNERQFARAVAKLRATGGTILLAPRTFRGELRVPARSWRPLHILGRPGTRVERIYLDGAQRVSIGRMTIAPVSGDAGVLAENAYRIALHDLVVTAQGTPFRSTVQLPDSKYVTIRRSDFSHCGDRSPLQTNCVWLRWAGHVTIEDNHFHDCWGCDFVHGRFRSKLVLKRNRFMRALPCRGGMDRCGHQDLVQLFAGRGLLVQRNYFGVYRRGAAQLYLTDRMQDVWIVNNVFVGSDPLVPGYRARVAMVIGSAGTPRVPRGVRVLNNTILTGWRRKDGYEGSIRMTNQYGILPKRLRPLLANNVIALLKVPNHVCSTVKESVANVIVRGVGCSSSDRVGGIALDRHGKPYARSAHLRNLAARRYAPSTDMTGRPRGASPDIGAYEYRG